MVLNYHSLRPRYPLSLTFERKRAGGREKKLGVLADAPHGTRTSSYSLCVHLSLVSTLQFLAHSGLLCGHLAEKVSSYSSRGPVRPHLPIFVGPGHFNGKIRPMQHFVFYVVFRPNKLSLYSVHKLILVFPVLPDEKRPYADRFFPAAFFFSCKLSCG